MGIIGLKSLKTKKGIINIESAEIIDANKIVSFRNKVLKETKYFFIEPDEEGFDMEDEKEYLKDKILSVEEFFLKATFKDEIIGTLDFSVETEKNGARIGDFGVAVRKSYNNLGVATEMLNIVFDWCKENRINKIRIEVDSENQKAIKLYEKYGFIYVKTLHESLIMPSGKKKNGLLMYKIGI